MDGARLFNAAVAPEHRCRRADAPRRFGDLLSEQRGFAPRSDRFCAARPSLSTGRGECAERGRGMRQAGILAAAGLVALREMVERLADDHARARTLAEDWPRFRA